MKRWRTGAALVGLVLSCGGRASESDEGSGSAGSHGAGASSGASGSAAVGSGGSSGSSRGPCTSAPDCGGCPTCFEACVCSGATPQDCAASCQRGTGGDTQESCRSRDTQLQVLVAVGKDCTRDSECTTFPGQCASAVEHCSGVVYVGPAFDREGFSSVHRGFLLGCGVCDVCIDPPASAVCVGGYCAPGS